MKVPEHVSCSKCQQSFNPRDYHRYPEANTPEALITRVYSPNSPLFSVQCPTCGQYTVFSPFEKDNPYSVATTSARRHGKRSDKPMS
jgi:hypothetical protein